MTTQPADAPLPDQELLDVAARLVGVQTVDLLKVARRTDGTLVVVLASGQKYVFNPEQIVTQLGTELDLYIRAQLAPKPAADPKPPKPKKT